MSVTDKFLVVFFDYLLFFFILTINYLLAEINYFNRDIIPRKNVQKIEKKV